MYSSISCQVFSYSFDPAPSSLSFGDVGVELRVVVAAGVADAARREVAGDLVEAGAPQRDERRRPFWSVKKSWTMFVVLVRFTVMPASAICSLMISPTRVVSGVELRIEVVGEVLGPRLLQQLLGLLGVVVVVAVELRVEVGALLGPVGPHRLARALVEELVDLVAVDRVVDAPDAPSGCRTAACSCTARRRSAVVSLGLTSTLMPPVVSASVPVSPAICAALVMPSSSELIGACGSTAAWVVWISSTPASLILFFSK